MKRELRIFLMLLGMFIFFYFLPVESKRFLNAIYEGLILIKWYAREHILLCLVPAFFIAGGIQVFISPQNILKYFGRNANKFLSYSVASISGTVLAVCSCTVLPLFSGIYKKGAGIGPATTFLYSGPAINILAIILTARVLGWKIGLARAVGAILFSVLIGILMHLFFERGDKKGENTSFEFGGADLNQRSLLKEVIFFSSMVGILVFANWANPEKPLGFWYAIYKFKWYLTALSLVILVCSLRWFRKEEISYWIRSSWEFAKQILPLLFVGVFVAGFFLGRPNHEGIIPSWFVTNLVGGNSLFSNFFAAIIGAFMYFATLTEVPILQGLINQGMGYGPALALLLAGPALSLPNMLVIRSVIGTKKTLVYVSLVVVMATISGLLFGSIMK
jgi:hypothetical protein